MRPYTQAIWKGFSPAEQRRALRAYTRVWAINRNRMAPAAWEWIEELRRAAACSRSSPARRSPPTETGPGLDVTLRRRDAAADPRSCGSTRAVNCIGPGDSPFGAGDPLYDRLRERGLARPHPLGLGLDTGRGRRRHGRRRAAQPWLSTLGWMRRGELWESVAIPELRDQASEIAARIGAAR